jgi:hypothetical protein
MKRRISKKKRSIVMALILGGLGMGGLMGISFASYDDMKREEPINVLSFRSAVGDKVKFGDGPQFTCGSLDNA